MLRLICMISWAPDYLINAMVLSERHYQILSWGLSWRWQAIRTGQCVNLNTQDFTVHGSDSDNHTCASASMLKLRWQILFTVQYANKSTATNHWGCSSFPYLQLCPPTLSQLIGIPEGQSKSFQFLVWVWLVNSTTNLQGKKSCAKLVKLFIGSEKMSHFFFYHIHSVFWHYATLLCFIWELLNHFEPEEKETNCYLQNRMFHLQLQSAAVPETSLINTYQCNVFKQVYVFERRGLLVQVVLTSKAVSTWGLAARGRWREKKGAESCVHTAIQTQMLHQLAPAAVR